MREQLQKIKEEAVAAISSAQADIEALRVKYLGKKGELTSVLRQMGSLSAEERQIGGLGILLVRELMDVINYERTDGQNVLTLAKAIADSNGSAEFKVPVTGAYVVQVGKRGEKIKKK